MAKEVLLIFQDCYDCHSNKAWYERQAVRAAELGIKITPMPFNALGAKGLILKAKNKGAARMPFLTDGANKFGYDIEKFIEKTEPAKTVTEVASMEESATTKRKAKKHGADTETN